MTNCNKLNDLTVLFMSALNSMKFIRFKKRERTEEFLKLNNEKNSHRVFFITWRKSKEFLIALMKMKIVKLKY